MNKLTTEEKIEEIKKLLDEQEENTELIDEIYALLNPGYDPETREMLIESIRRGEEDIKHGRVHTPEQVLEWLENRFKK